LHANGSWAKLTQMSNKCITILTDLPMSPTELVTVAHPLARHICNPQHPPTRSRPDGLRQSTPSYHYYLPLVWRY
jgi:hypothetical protein